MSFFVNDDLGDIKGFEAMFQQRLINQKKGFVNGYKSGLETMQKQSKIEPAGFVTKQTVGLLGDIKTDSGRYVEGNPYYYQVCGQKLGLIEGLIKFNTNVSTADNIFEMEKMATAFINEIKSVFPEEFPYVRDRLSKTITQTWGKNFGKNNEDDQFIAAIMRALAT